MRRVVDEAWTGRDRSTGRWFGGSGLCRFAGRRTRVLKLEVVECRRGRMLLVMMTTLRRDDGGAAQMYGKELSSSSRNGVV